MATKAKKAAAVKADKASPEDGGFRVHAPVAPVAAVVEAPKVVDSKNEALAVDDTVTFSGKITSLNEPLGVTVRVGSEKSDFCDIALPAVLITKD